MSSKRLYQILLGCVVGLVVALLGGAYAINSLLQKQANTLASERQQVEILKGQQVALTRARADVKKYESLATIAKAIVPQDKSQAQAVGEIVKIAHANGIKLASVSFPNSTLGGTTGTSTAGSALSQLTPVLGIPGVYSLPISIQSDTANLVPYTHFQNFLRGLENNRRTSLVTAINIAPDSKNPTLVSFALTLQEYIKP